MIQCWCAKNEITVRELNGLEKYLFPGINMKKLKLIYLAVDILWKLLIKHLGRKLNGLRLEFFASRLWCARKKVERVLIQEHCWRAWPLSLIVSTLRVALVKVRTYTQSNMCSIGVCSHKYGFEHSQLPQCIICFKSILNICILENVCAAELRCRLISFYASVTHAKYTFAKWWNMFSPGEIPDPHFRFTS